MLLKVGELARRCGLTVRTLHHYDDLGLLSPSARSDSGYRLYNRHDIARLHQIQALRRFGLSLADIGAVLANPDSNLQSIIERQIQALDDRISQSIALRDRLCALHGQLLRGEEPELADWLKTLEMMTMYDKYFSKEDQKRFALLSTAENSTHAEWQALAQEVREAMAAGIPPDAAAAQSLAKRWMAMLTRDSQGDPRLLAKLNDMHLNEPDMQQASGVSLEMLTYVRQAFAESKFPLYGKYLSPAEFKFLRENYLKRTHEFPALIAQLHQHMEDGTPADDPRMLALARQWLELVRSYAGDDPATHTKLCEAYAREPELSEGTWMTPAMSSYLGQTMRALGVTPAPQDEASPA